MKPHRPADSCSGAKGVPVRLNIDDKLPASDFRLDHVRRILVVKLDRVGDWILGLPFLRNLRENAPSATIDVVVTGKVRELAASCPDIDRTFALSRESGAPRFDGRTPADTLAFERDYLRGAYDLTVVPRWDVDFDGASRIAERSRAPIILGFSEHCTERKRVLNRGYDTRYTHVVDDLRLVHEVEHNLGLISVMNGRIRTRHAGINTSQSDRLKADGLLSPDHLRNPLIAIAPFAAEPKRHLPLRELAETVAPLLDLLDASAVIIGGADHRDAGKYLASDFGLRAISIAGQCTLSESAAVIGRCDAMVAADSGPAHIAAAVGTPVAVFSCHPLDGRAEHENSPLRFAPWSDTANTLIVQPERATWPCQDHCEADAPHCILEALASGRHELHRFIEAAVDGRSNAHRPVERERRQLVHRSEQS